MLFNQAPLLTKQSPPDDRSIWVDFIWVNESTCSINCPIFAIVRELKRNISLNISVKFLYITTIQVNFLLLLFFNNEKEKQADT